MSHALAVVPLRLGLAVLRLVQPALPGAAGAALRHAARLRLTGDECDAEPPVDALRQRLRHDAEAVEVDGAERRVADLHRRASPGPAWGRFLFGLVRGLRPRRVLEVGTGLGVGAAHLAAGLALNEAEGTRGRLVTVEARPALAARAAGAFARLGHPVGDDGCRVRVVVGPLGDTLPGVAAKEGPFDLVLVDGALEDAAVETVAALRPHLAAGALVVVDGVEPFGPGRRAWVRLRESGPSFYAVRYGLLVHLPDGDAGGAATAAARETAPSLPAGAA